MRGHGSYVDTPAHNENTPSSLRFGMAATADADLSLSVDTFRWLDVINIVRLVMFKKMEEEEQEEGANRRERR